MTTFDGLDRSLWVMEGETRLYPKLYRDGGYRVFVGPKSSDAVAIMGREAFIQKVFGEGLSARFAVAGHESGNRRSAINGDIAGWDADPEIAPLIEGALAMAGRSILRVAKCKVPTTTELLAKLQEKLAALGSTERMAMVRQRIGQALYREAQCLLWEGRCAATGLGLEPVLRASHAKPWSRRASPAEQLDPYNGFLLAPHIDALFDKGFLSFDATGTVIWSECLASEERGRLGLPEELRIRGIDPRHDSYLTYHREEVLRKHSGADNGTTA